MDYLDLEHYNYPRNRNDKIEEMQTPLMGSLLIVTYHSIRKEVEVANYKSPTFTMLLLLVWLFNSSRHTRVLLLTSFAPLQ